MSLVLESTKNHPRAISYVVECNPIPLQRARFGKRRVWDEQQQIKFNYGIALSNQHNNRPQFSGPLRLDAMFYFPLPQSWQQKKKIELLGRAHSSRPDLDNLIKFILDVANGILYKDDCLFAEIYAHKVYDKIGKTKFTITELK